MTARAPRHGVEHAEDLVGFRGRQHGGRLVEDHEAAGEIELLQDLDLLLLARGEARDGPIEVELERDRLHEAGEPLALAAPGDHGGHVVARHDQVLRHRHARHQREVLVDHADAERVGIVRGANGLLARSHHDLAGVGLVVADQALHERALARAVFPEERVEGARRDARRHVLEGGDAAEALGHADDLHADGAIRAFLSHCGRDRRRTVGHQASAVTTGTRSVERATAPNTPPCIVIILTAAR